MNPFEKLFTGGLVRHKSNSDILFIAYQYDKTTGIYKCRHLSSTLQQGSLIVELEFRHEELEGIDMSYHRPNWGEYVVVRHRTNPTLDLLTLEAIGGRKTKCKWVTFNIEVGIRVDESIFEDFELTIAKKLDHL